MKLLFYAVVFCFAIGLITAEEKEEEEEEGTEAGGEAATDSETAKAVGGKGEEEEGAGEEEGGERGSKSKSGETTMATTRTTKKPAETEGEGGNGTAKGKAPPNAASPEAKGKRKLFGRCRSTIPEGNCVPNSRVTMWYFDGGICTPHHVGGCSLKRKQQGYWLCLQCTQKCMGLKLTDKKIKKICRKQA
ncbi:uncharacterized protein LOC119373989 [Rhipicephalus sanguineus]|uniref:uncharacterized protein LOC119373989 n=1 Tax=Rhipicephalus sanguineus TaxID=34632 RepID=UPI0018941B56|nr:uncharacterized protein LOC119373989 [Rhipicephalus sanguineus]